MLAFLPHWLHSTPFFVSLSTHLSQNPSSHIRHEGIKNKVESLSVQEIVCRYMKMVVVHFDAKDSGQLLPRLCGQP